MKLIVGLGNPGQEYRGTRHNVGFAAIDQLADSLGIGLDRLKFDGVYGQARYGGHKVFLLKPLTYMNKSGQSIRQISAYFDIVPQDTIVIYDDMDIEFGEIKIRKKGSSGSHNGMKSIIYQLQSEDFPRIRIGIGRRHPRQDLTSFVLSKFSKDEQVFIDQAVEKAAKASLSIIDDGIDNAMNKYN